jgi:hypothetical protein
MMQLRWLITSNKITADDLKKFRSESGMSFIDAKRSLENRTQPILQYMTLGGEWADVPTAVEYRTMEIDNELI